MAKRIEEELGRGVTALKGKGILARPLRNAILSAITGVQVDHLRDISQQADADGFAVIGVAAEVRGGGFRPFGPPG